MTPNLMCVSFPLKASASGDVSCVDEILKVSCCCCCFNTFFFAYDTLLSSCPFPPIFHEGSGAADSLHVKLSMSIKNN